MFRYVHWTRRRPRRRRPRGETADDIEDDRNGAHRSPVWLPVRDAPRHLVPAGGRGRRW